METTSYIALSAQGALRREMQSIAHNMANMNTTGFKGERMMFVDHLVRTRSDNFIADQKLAYVRDVASFRDMSEGPIKQTGNPLDVAIHGDGYFVAQAQDGGELYTRSGNFHLDSTGQLVTSGGRPVLSDAGAPIFFAPGDTNITIAGDGTISTQNGTLARLRVVTFDSPHALDNVAGGFYTTDQPAIDKLDAQVAQGALEGSNIEPILEMTRMMEVSREYERCQDMLKREDQRIRDMVRVMPTLSPA